MQPRRQIALHLDVTGSNGPSLERIVQIDAIELNTKEKKRYHTLVNPDERVISDDKTKLHGLSTTDEAIKNAPLFENVVMDFLRFVKDSDVIMHCAFTHAILSAACDVAKKKHLKQVAHSVDYTYNLFNELHPECKKSVATLSHIVKHYKLEEFKPRGKTLVAAIKVMKKELHPEIEMSDDEKPVAEEKMNSAKKLKIAETASTPPVAILAKPDKPTKAEAKIIPSVKPLKKIRAKPITKKANDDISSSNIIEGRRTRSMFAKTPNSLPAKTTSAANDKTVMTKKRKRN